MILIGVAALGMAEIRPGWGEFHIFWTSMNHAPSGLAYARMVQSSLTIVLINLAVGYVWIRLISPKLPWRDMIRQPGMLILILMIASALLYGIVSVFLKTGASANMVLGVVLGLSWAAACFHFRSRVEPGWIEVLGRVFAVGLIIAVATSYF